MHLPTQPATSQELTLTSNNAATAASDTPAEDGTALTTTVATQQLTATETTVERIRTRNDNVAYRERISREWRVVDGQLFTPPGNATNNATGSMQTQPTVASGAQTATLEPSAAERRAEAELRRWTLIRDQLRSSDRYMLEAEQLAEAQLTQWRALMEQRRSGRNTA